MVTSPAPRVSWTKQLSNVALADRLAEAVAERMHQRVRTEFWG
jgi:cobalamin-dependent methionine synthase I